VFPCKVPKMGRLWNIKYDLYVGFYHQYRIIACRDNIKPLVYPCLTCIWSKPMLCQYIVFDLSLGKVYNHFKFIFSSNKGTLTLKKFHWVKVWVPLYHIPIFGVEIGNIFFLNERKCPHFEFCNKKFYRSNTMSKCKNKNLWFILD
jgi:hypothetical protein